jgi:hypothetical protein
MPNANFTTPQIGRHEEERGRRPELGDGRKIGVIHGDKIAWRTDV